MVAVSPDVSEREHVLVRTRAHTAALTGAFLPVVAALGLLALALRALPSGATASTSDTLVLSASAGLVAVAVGRLLVRVWEWNRTVLAVTEEQILVVQSTVRRETRSVPLCAVERLSVTRSLPGRLLGYGSIVVENEGRRSSLAFVPQPDRVSGLIAAQVRPPDAVRRHG